MRKSICKSIIAIVFTCAICPFSSGRDLLAGEAPAKGRAVAASSIEYKSGTDSTMNEKEFFSKLQAADEDAFKREFEMYFVLLLSPEQKEAYDRLQSLDEKKAYLQHYWKAANPNPLLPENDWLLEFLRRRAYARENYKSSKPPFVDDRGIYYIKYGKPQRRYEDPGGILRVKFTNDERARRFFGLNSPVNYTMIANETWSYENVNQNFTVHFVKEGISFREAKNLMEIIDDKRAMQKAVRIGDQDMIYWLWADMVKKRAAVSPTLARTASEVINVETSIVLHVPLFEPPKVILRNRAYEMTRNTKLARDTAPSAAHDPIQVENRLEFFDQIAQFRGPGGKTRIEIDLLVPFKKNLLKKFKKSSKDTLNVEFSGMLRDLNFEPLIQNQAFSSFAVKLAAREKLPNAVGKFALLAKPQTAEITLQVAEKQREKTGYYRQACEIRNFSGKELMISDIQLNYEVKREAQKKLLPTLQNDSFLVSPYPYKEISKKTPPLFYFEIYNIQSAGIHENLQISYTITPVEDNSNVLKSLSNLFSRSEKASVIVTFTRPVVSENMQELIEIDFKNVKKGWNLLEVSVSSLQDQTIKAVVQKKLFVKE